MKWINVLAWSLLASSALSADQTLVSTMAHMEKGLNNVQKGFLYNTPDLIKNGVKEIHDANALFHNSDATKRYLPKEKQHLSNIAFNASKRIDKSSAELIAALDKKQFSKAGQSYSELVHACTACHGVVRGW